MTETEKKSKWWKIWHELKKWYKCIDQEYGHVSTIFLQQSKPNSYFFVLYFGLNLKLDRGKAIECKVNQVAQFLKVNHETQAFWYEYFADKSYLNNIEHNQDVNMKQSPMNFHAQLHIKNQSIKINIKFSKSRIFMWLFSTMF